MMPGWFSSSSWQASSKRFAGENYCLQWFIHISIQNTYLSGKGRSDKLFKITGRQKILMLRAAYQNLLWALGPVCRQQLSQGPSTSFVQDKVKLGKLVVAALAAYAGLFFLTVENSNAPLRTLCPMDGPISCLRIVPDMRRCRSRIKGWPLLC